MFNSSTLIASLIWGSVGFGFFIYGKKQQEWVVLCGGIAVMAISYFISSALYMSLVAIILVAATLWLQKMY
jgi:hypothetical protein